MRVVNVYEQALSGGDSMLISAGSYNLSLTFRWPETIQEQVDIVQRQVKNLSVSDPLIMSDGSYNRNYDYLDFYINIPDYGEGMEEWLETTPDIPQSLRERRDPTDIYTIQERKQFCVDLKGYLDDLLAMLVYTCVIEDGGETTIMSVRKGAYCNWRSSSWSLKFNTDLDEIGKDDLDKVTAEIITYEFV